MDSDCEPDGTVLRWSAARGGAGQSPRGGVQPGADSYKGEAIEDMMSALWELLKEEDGFHADLSSMAAVNILNHLQTALDRYRETALEIETDLKDYGEKLSEDDSI